MNKRRQQIVWALSLTSAGLVSAVVVPESELEANKPQLEHTKDAGNFILDWETQPGVFYFIEGSPDLVNWLPAKLLKDNADSGSLSLGTAINLSKAFYRVSLEGDPGSARLRADDDGDGIINLLEVEAGWDAFAPKLPTDSDSDGIPDYFEQFHFGTLDYDDNYVAVEGGLRLAEAYANATDPNSTDSDGDGWTDRQELDWGWDLNYDQSRDDPKYGSTGDFDGDGISNMAEALNDTDPTDELQFVSPPPNYALIDLGANREFIGLSENGHVVTWDTSNSNQEAEVWFFGDTYMINNNAFSINGIAGNGDLFGIITSPELDENQAVEGLVYESDPINCGNVAGSNNYIGSYVSGKVAYGGTEPQIIKPHLELLLEYGCQFLPIFHWNLSVSDDGQLVAGDAFDYALPIGQRKKFFYTAVLNGNEMSDLVQYTIPEEATDLRIFGLSNSGNLLYQYRESHDGDLKYGVNGSILNVDRVFGIDGDANVLAAKNGKIFLYHESSQTLLIEGDYAAGYAEKDELAYVLKGRSLFQQKFDEQTGSGIPLGSVDAFVQYPLADICDAHTRGFTELSGEAISEDASFIAASAVKDGVNHTLLLLKMDVVPDWDRNGVIDQADRGKATDSDPFRFWVNDDDDRVGQEVSNDDVPGQTGGDADAVTGFSGQVDGMRDLVDFFPLFFDLEDFLSSFDDLTTVDLKLSGEGMRFLKYEDGYAGFAPDEAGKFLRDIDTARELADDDTRGISTDPNSPTDLGAEFVTLASQGKGVLLMESYAATDEPLTLHAFVDGTELFKYEFHLKTSGVEEMFEHRDLTGLAKEYDGTTASVPQSPAGTRTTAPNWPNELTNGKTFAFVHGYNVSGQAARGWHAEVFKRMHQLGSNARFVGITWNGDTGLDYHKAVFQAFHTGDSFNASLGGDITVAAHSLGNVVVGQAIQSGSLIPTRYYMLNAATPNEAYGTGGSSTDMVEKDWVNIQDTSLYASNWYQEFDVSDGRSGFAWKEAFILVPDRTEVHNFYSPGEDVLDVLDGDNDASVLGQLLTGNFNFVRGAWKSQELVKGKTGFGSLASLALSRGQAGWRLNSNYETGDDIKEIPRFSPFREANLHSSNAQTASDTATQNVRFDVLARGIPALSDAAAVDTVPGVINFDMEASGRDPNEWPSEDHSGESLGDWLHSDFRNVALPYVHLMYQEMINQGTLNEN